MLSPTMGESLIRTTRYTRRARGARISLLAAAVLFASCSSAPKTDERYRPAENILEVIAVLRRHVPDDTYRFESARDFTGRNVYRSSLLRLESLERVHFGALQAGHMDGVVAFAKARALERLRAFSIATAEYRLAAEREPSLSVEALRSADVCSGLQKALAFGMDLDALTDRGADAALSADDPDAMVAQFEERLATLDSVAAAVVGTHHTYLVREEIERTDVARSRYFEAIRNVTPGGNLRAISELQRVVVRHRDSKNSSHHLLALADLYVDLSEEYIEANPPESMRFDPVRFQELIESASRLFQVVSNRDGTPQKLEASRRLEAFLAFALRVDRDRFTP